MTAYSLWLCSDAYARSVYVNRWLSLRYRVALNDVGSASLNLPIDNDRIASIALMQRLLIYRDGTLVYGGMLQDEGWALSEAAPAQDMYVLDAFDHAAYLNWRTIPRPVGQHFDTVTGAADDVAKSFVRRHLGATAIAARQFTDVTVQADAGAAGSTSRNWVGGTLLEHLQRLAEGKTFCWRFVPSATGAEFRTAYPLWGLDRSKGNGANVELVFSRDRKNVAQMTYKKALSGHYNYMYMAGGGEGKDQVMVEHEDATARAAYKRREWWVSATNYTVTANLQDEGDSQIAAMKAVEEMTVIPRPGILTPANLGDKCTIFERRYGRVFEKDMIITAITFTVGNDGVEHAEPEMVAA